MMSLEEWKFADLELMRPDWSFTCPPLIFLLPYRSSEHLFIGTTLTNTKRMEEEPTSSRNPLETVMESSQPGCWRSSRTLASMHHTVCFHTKDVFDFRRISFLGHKGISTRRLERDY